METQQTYTNPTPNGLSDEDWRKVPVQVQAFVLARCSRIQPMEGEGSLGRLSAPKAMGGSSSVAHPPPPRPVALKVSDEVWLAAAPEMHVAVVSMAGWYDGQIRGLEERFRDLKEKAETNSTNSSKPPSSDPPSVHPPKRKKSGRQRGAQPGHEGHFHEPLPEKDVTGTVDHFPSRCEHCSGELPDNVEPDPDPAVHQVIDSPVVPRQVINHRLHQSICPHCKRQTRAQLPAGVPRSPFGPGVMARATYLTGRLHASRRKTVQALGDLYGVPISVGGLKNIESRVSEALAPAVTEVGVAIQKEPVLNADETPWWENGKGYLWAFVTPKLALFHVNPSRSQEVAKELLGSFNGVLGTDRYAGYGWYPIKLRQVCHAHLKRDFQKMVDRGGDSAKIGTQALAEQARLWDAWFNFVAGGEIAVTELQNKIKPIRARMMRTFKRGAECKDTKAAGGCKRDHPPVEAPVEVVPEPTAVKGKAKKRKNLCDGCPMFKTAGTCKKLIKDFPALWTFAEYEGVEPTNNTSEQAVREGVLWRKGSFGSRSEGGSRYVERMLTSIETTRRQGRNFFAFLLATITAAIVGLPGPSLLPGVEHVQPQPSPAGTNDTEPPAGSAPAEQPHIEAIPDSS